MIDRDGLMEVLAGLGIAPVVYSHPPLHSVADGVGVTDAWPAGAHIKNLFVKDKAGALTLITCLQERKLDLVKLGKHVGSKDRWSFANEEVLWSVLGVKPGAVTPLALVNAAPGSLRVIWDAAMLEPAIVYAHPLVNTQTLGMVPADLIRAVAAWGHQPVRMGLGEFAKA